ncbi:MAG: competence protein ComEA [Bermanella sp.]|jgi:competence protein ComEA
MKLISTIPSIFLIILLSIFSLQTYADSNADNNIAQQDIQILNINSASAEDISKSLKGVGIKKAQAIVDYRESYGDFHNVDELTAVKGIGKNTLAKNVHLISLE